MAWLHFSLQAGHEQAGHRPALNISPAAYNGNTSLMLCCPMTTQVKGYPFEVILSGTRPSAVLADQVKSLDCAKRKANYKGKAKRLELANVRAKIIALIGGRAIPEGLAWPPLRSQIVTLKPCRGNERGRLAAAPITQLLCAATFTRQKGYANVKKSNRSSSAGVFNGT
jgi:mRNA interferase MazF